MQLTKSLLHTTDAYIRKLREAGVETVRDFLSLFPRGIEDKSEMIEDFSLINIKEKQAIKCTIELLTEESTRNKKLLIKAVLTDKSGFHAEAVWWNRRMILTQFHPGDTVIIYGLAKYEYGRLSWNSADIEHYHDKRREVVPVYSDVNYIPGTWIREKMPLLRGFITEFTDDIPEPIRTKKWLRPKYLSIRDIHFPESIDAFERAKQELGYGELFQFQLRGIEKKNKAIAESEWLAPAIPLDIELVKSIIADLPFPLTNKQKIVLFQILKDMEHPHAMARLLQGDVGTGKTVVALIAAMHAIIKNQPHPNPLLKERESKKMHNDALWNLFELAKEMRKNPTDTEDMAWWLLRNGWFFWLKFRRQHPFSTYIADFYCHEKNIVIEIDGKIHENQIEYDRNRDLEMSEKWITVYRFKNEEVQDIENFISKLEAILSPLSGGEGAGMNWTPLSFRRGAGGEVQVAIMAPTEILARQHFAGNESWLMKWGIRADLLVGSLTPRMKEDARERLKSGQTDIIFGTHALIQDSVQFARLGFVVVDEQHRFWVEQRKLLEEYISPQPSPKGEGVGLFPLSEGEGINGWGGIVPHRLNMSATPIPRTLALTLYGDQDVSVLDEYPVGRKPIHTRVVREDQRIEMYRFIEEEVRQWRQVYWISPLVDGTRKSESVDENKKNGGSGGETVWTKKKNSTWSAEREGVSFLTPETFDTFGYKSMESVSKENAADIASAVEMQITLSSVFPKLTIGLIHGKMSGKEKDRVMQEFYGNKIHILSSTSVVEVGVNNPNASIICIEAAERFGLSQLHQFRGRVGRGDDQSYCYLFTTKEYKTDRLKAMEKTNDGFELAEIDLELRWPGEAYGVRQSWVPDLHFADITDFWLVSEIREDIEEWMRWR